MRGKKSARAFAPASVANVAVGFDILGFSLGVLGDTATIEKTEKSGLITIEPIHGFSSLPLDPEKNTATRGLIRLLRDTKCDFGLRVRIEKGIPMGSGLGGSAASAVAAAVAANSLLEKPLPLEELASYCLDGEEAASGARHGDNVIPSLLGGLRLVQSLDPLIQVNIPVPDELYCTVIHPKAEVRTEAARKILKPEVPLKLFIQQSAHLGGLVAGCYRGDFPLIGRSLQDHVIEPQRKSLVPGFDALQLGASEWGALGCSISGSGPSVFAWCEGEVRALAVRSAWIETMRALGHDIHGAWVCPVGNAGARLL